MNPRFSNPSKNGLHAGETSIGSTRGGSAGSDAELVLAARRGDKKAFVEIVARYQAMVCGIALGVLGDFAASEDAGQEAFLTAWRRFHDLREPGRLRAWLAQIARNAALGQLRRKRGHDALDDASDATDDAPAPDEVTAREEEVAMVRESLANLPETYRMPLVLFYTDGKSVRAVAEALGISEDAVKQRLARGREMLRDRMSGLVETALSRSGPSPIFTMVIAAAIGALAAPSVIAGSVFATTALAGGATSGTTSSTASLVTAMTTSKALLLTTALVTVLCIPIGYRLQTEENPAPVITHTVSRIEIVPPPSAQTNAPNFEKSALFAEWRQLHDTYGTYSAAMPLLHQAIDKLKDPFRRRAFLAALISEWVQVDPAAGFAFLMGKKQVGQQRRQFFDEWLAQDPRAAVDALVASPPGWEGFARESLVEIARRAPARIGEIAARLPKSNNFWDTAVRDAFAIVAEGGLAAARAGALNLAGPNREQALAGVAKTWARSDLDGAIAWARTLPEGTDRNEIIRAALMGRAAIDPASALDRVDLVPPGGKQTAFASTTGARVLMEAAKTDFDATLAWIAAHPGRLGHEDMVGMAEAVTDRLNADAAGFLTRQAAAGSLEALAPAISSAILNEAGGQREAIWEWLRTQPDNEASRSLREEVLDSAAWQDPDLAMRLSADLPNSPEGNEKLKSLAQSLLNGGSALHRFDTLLEQAPERLRQPLIEEAFDKLRADSLGDPKNWIGRLSLLPDELKTKGVEAIARAWALRTPEGAVEWAVTLSEVQGRGGALAAITSAWAATDVNGAAAWVGAMSPGAERDRSAESLVLAIGSQHPREAWEWALSISDQDGRSRAVVHAAEMMAARDPATARRWIETSPLPPALKAEILSGVDRAGRASGPRGTAAP
jgi:RNA polymerase sigma factor (sigma-70 family)